MKLNEDINEQQESTQVIEYVHLGIHPLLDLATLGRGPTSVQDDLRIVSLFVNMTAPITPIIVPRNGAPK